MIDQITAHARAAAAAHGVAVDVYEFEEFIDDKWTGRFGCSVSFRQSVYTRPEDKKGRVNSGECRRIIGMSATDGRRLFKARKGNPGGQDYIMSRGVRQSISCAAESPEAAQRAVLDAILSGAAREMAHDVADEAARIEVEMRAKLRSDLDALGAA